MSPTDSSSYRRHPRLVIISVWSSTQKRLLPGTETRHRLNTGSFSPRSLNLAVSSRTLSSNVATSSGRFNWMWYLPSPRSFTAVDMSDTRSGSSFVPDPESTPGRPATSAGMSGEPGFGCDVAGVVDAASFTRCRARARPAVTSPSEGEVTLMSSGRGRSSALSNDARSTPSGPPSRSKAPRIWSSVMPDSRAMSTTSSATASFTVSPRGPPPSATRLRRASGTAASTASANDRSTSASVESADTGVTGLRSAPVPVPPVGISRCPFRSQMACSLRSLPSRTASSSESTTSTRSNTISSCRASYHPPSITSGFASSARNLRRYSLMSCSPPASNSSRVMILEWPGRATT